MSSNTSQPRYLTHEEIEDIVASIPYIYGADGLRASDVLENTSGKVARTCIQDFYRKQLQYYQIAPDGVETLKEEFRKRFTRAAIDGGEPVGFNAAESISEPTIQMTLNTFHKAGSASNVTAGFERLQEIAHTQKTKNPAMTVVFRDNTTLQQALGQKRRELVGLRISDVVEDYEIIYGDNHKYEYWYAFYNRFVGSAYKSKSYFLRLVLDLQQLYTYRLTMPDVALSILSTSKGEIRVVYSPVTEAKVDVHIVQASVKQDQSVIDQENLTSIKYNLTTFDRNQIVKKPSTGKRSKLPQGINGVRSAVPVQTEITSFIAHEEYRGNGIWDCHYNQEALYTSGLSVSRIVELFRKSGMRIAKQPEEERNKFVRVSADKKPTSVVSELLEAKKSSVDPYQSLATMVTMQTLSTKESGSNLVDTLSLEDVDPNHTFSNDIHEVLEVFGIEAVRNLIIMEIADVVNASGAYINIRHITLIADYLTGRGFLTPFTYHGMKKRGFGPLTVASFERSQEEFIEAAALGKKEEITSGTPSASLYFANTGLYGTGYSKILPDKEQAQQQMQSGKKLSSSSISSALSKMGQGAKKKRPQPPPAKTAPVAPKKVGKPQPTTVGPSSQAPKDSKPPTSLSTPGQALEQVGQQVGQQISTCIDQRTTPSRTVSSTQNTPRQQPAILPVTEVSASRFIQLRSK